MRYINVDSVEPGQLLGKSIFSSNGTVLLAENVQITTFMITTLKRIGVSMVFIKDPNFEDVELEEVVSEETKRAVISKMEQMFEAVRSGKDFNTRAISISVNQLLDEVMQNSDVLVQLSDIRSEDNASYLHAMNVCIMSSLIGINLGLSATQLKELAIGALLHDIGKVGQTGEDDPETKNHHTWRGFEIIKNKREYSLLIAHSALQHHEHIDGSGKPRGLDKEQIHLYPKIVAVANTYDNLLHDLSSTKRVLPHEACERMMAMSGRQLDHEVLLHFLKTVSIYPTGSSVRLSTKETGVVVGQHRGLPSRPIVRIVESDEHKRLSIKEIDLSEHTTIFIESVLA